MELNLAVIGMGISMESIHAKARTRREELGTDGAAPNSPGELAADVVAGHLLPWNGAIGLGGHGDAVLGAGKDDDISQYVHPGASLHSQFSTPFCIRLLTAVFRIYIWNGFPYKELRRIVFVCSFLIAVC